MTPLRLYPPREGYAYIFAPHFYLSLRMLGLDLLNSYQLTDAACGLSPAYTSVRSRASCDQPECRAVN